jgi:cellobiose-specific phosphotransferase system component IIB
MNNLKYLELHRLIKELQFVEFDYIYHSEIINQSELLFKESVNNILEEHQALKALWEENTKTNFIETKIIEKENIEENINNTDVVEISPEIKKIYREIVKNTHPDMVKSQKLNELYLEATSAYETNDIVTLYKVSSDLMIDFPLNDEEFGKIELKIEKYKNQIEFLKSTYVFKWLKSNDNDKSKIVLKFIENIIK